MTIPGSDGRAQVTLRPMTTDEFESWRERSIQTYAEDITNASGRPLEATLDRAREQFAELLPVGLASEHSWLLRILDADGTDVGALWLVRPWAARTPRTSTTSRSTRLIAGAVWPGSR